MAEGGNGCHRDTSSPDTGAHSLDSRLLECPICLEHLRQPKSLPCLHCFCQDCLSSFITKEPSDKMPTSFLCPVCRRVTQPINPSEKRENWARQFPTNSLIQELIQFKIPSLGPLYCKPCRKKGKMESPAEFWCKTVNMLFCEACKVGVHDIIHEECDTIVTAGTDVLIPSEIPVFVKCNKHKEKIDYYCEDHKILGCNKCIILDHRPCKVVTTTEEYCETLKTRSKRDNLHESLQTSADTIGILMEDFSYQIQTLVKQQDTGLKTIKELRKQIDKCLDEMEKGLTDELITAVKQEKENIVVIFHQCEQLQTSILKTLESSKSATLKNDNIETILLYQRGQMEVETCKDLVTEMLKAYTFVSVRHIIDPKQKNIGKDTRLNLGKIEVEKHPRQLPSGTEYLKPPLSDYCVTEMQKCHQLETSTLNTLESSKAATLKNDNVETILLYQRGQMEEETSEDSVTETRKTYTPLNVRHTIDLEQQNIEKDTTLNLGKIEAEKEPKQVPGCTSHLTLPLSKCAVKEILKFCIKTPSDSKGCDARGVVYLPDGYIVVGDYCNCKLKLYTHKGQYLDKMKIKGDPQDMCVVDNNTVAVAVSRPGSVHVVNVKSSKLSLLYSIKSPKGAYCYGVSHRNGKFAVSTLKQVYSMTRDGKTELLHTLPTDCYSLTYDPEHGHIYSSQYINSTSDTAVYRMTDYTRTGKLKNGVLKSAWGVDVDRESNVYVCGYWSNNVVQMSCDGTNIRELLTSSNGIMNPQAISVCGDKFVVTTLGDRNYVKVYQLS